MDDRAADTAQHIVYVEAARHRAELVASFWHTLKDQRIPVHQRREFTLHEFWYAPDIAWEDDD